MTDMTMAQKIIQARLGGKTERCHNIPHLGSYSDAAHSWGVAILMWHLWPEDFPRLAIYCLSHDVPEGWVGDIPAPTLRYVPGVAAALKPIEGNLNRAIGLPGEDELNEVDLAKLKACDRLDFYLWAREQFAFGNTFVQQSIIELERFFKETPLPPEAQKLFGEFLQNDIRPIGAGVMKEAAKQL